MNGRWSVSYQKELGFYCKRLHKVLHPMSSFFFFLSFVPSLSSEFERMVFFFFVLSDNFFLFFTKCVNAWTSQQIMNTRSLNPWISSSFFFYTSNRLVSYKKKKKKKRWSKGRRCDESSLSHPLTAPNSQGHLAFLRQSVELITVPPPQNGDDRDLCFWNWCRSLFCIDMNPDETVL